MPKVHRRTFVFLITFMKHLLKYSEANGLDPKVLGKLIPFCASLISQACFPANIACQHETLKARKSYVTQT